MDTKAMMNRVVSPSSTPPSLTLATVSMSEHQMQENCVHKGMESRNERLDQLRVMIAQENAAAYKCCDYLLFDGLDAQSGNEGSVLGNRLNAGCRTSLCEWMYRIVDHFGVDREVVAIAQSFVDRVISVCRRPDRRTFELISSTSLQLAIKIHSPKMWREIGELLPVLSQGDFNVESIIIMEKEITHWLKWCLNPSTPQSIALYFISFLPTNIPRSVLNDVLDTTLFFIELSICDYYFVTTPNSIVAIAAILNATENLGFDHHEFNQDVFSYRNDFRSQIEMVLTSINYEVDWIKISAVRPRLWRLFRQCSECSIQGDLMTSIVSKRSRDDVLDIPSPTSTVHTKRCRSCSNLDFRQVKPADVESPDMGSPQENDPTDSRLEFRRDSRSCKVVKPLAL